MAKITKDTLIAEALKCGDKVKIADILRGYGMHCLGCALARGESVGEAATAHGVNVDEMLKALNEACE